MRQFRHRTRYVCLALVALATQIAMSSVHTHAARVPDASLALACRTFFEPADDANCPPLRKHGNDCAVCWMLAAAGTPVLPEPPAITLPSPEAGSWQHQIPSAHVVVIRPQAFDARGPPLSVAA